MAGYGIDGSLTKAQWEAVLAEVRYVGEAPAREKQKREEAVRNAAPELLAALEECEALLRAYAEGEQPNRGNAVTAVLGARAAIRKAKGEA